MRSASSLAVARAVASLGALFPGTTALDLSRAARVSNDTPPLYLPLVWHSAQRALSSGRMSWAKSTASAAGVGPASAREATTSSARNRIDPEKSLAHRPGR